MGMFTEVFDPITGEWVQFKTGNDGCNRYQLGNVLPYEADEYETNVFRGLGGGDKPNHRFDDYHVVVKDKRIVAVVKSAKVDKDDYDTANDEESVLRRLYMIEPYQSFKEMAECLLDKPTWLGNLWQRVWPWSSLNKYARHLRKPDTMEAMAMPLIHQVWPRRKRPDIVPVRPMGDGARGVVTAKIYHPDRPENEDG